MKNLLNANKVAQLREVAVLKGLDTKLKKAELVDQLLSSIEIANGGNFVTFNRNAINGVVTNDNVIPNGALVAHSVKDSYTVEEVTVSKYLCRAHANAIKKAVKEDTLAELNTEVFSVTEYAEVMVIRTLGDYRLAKMLFGTYSNNVKVEGLETVEFIDYSTASNYIDGIFFTKEAVSELGRVDSVDALQGLEFATLIMFNGIIDNITKVNHNPLFIEEVSIDVKNCTSKKVKKNQYKVLKVNVEELELDFANKRYVLPEDAGVYVDMSENRIFRKYGLSLTNDKGLDYLGVPSFLVFDATARNTNVLTAKARQALENKIDLIMDCIIPMGFYNAHTDTHVNVCAQSASQARKGNYYFTDLSVDMVQEEFIYGFDFGDEFVMANKQARAGLAFTSATPTSLKPNVYVLKDANERVFSKTVYPTGVDKKNGVARIADDNGNVLIANGESVKEFTPNDGAGLIEVRPAMTLAYDLGLVSFNDYKFFIDNYTTMAALTIIKDNIHSGEEVSLTERRLLKIFLSIPKAYQIRFAGDKGLLSIFPFSEYRTDLAQYDIIEGSNMRKYKLSDYTNVSFEVASYSHHASEEVQLNYQFVQNLNIAPEKLIELAERKLSQVDKDILVNPTSAIKFLGLVERYNDTDEETGLTTKFAKVLTANPNMLHDTYIQQSIKKLLVKYVYLMAFATIPVKGSYHYVISDPFHFLGEGKKNVNGLTDMSMKAGENYLNNKVATVGCFRSPMIHESEAQRVDLVENDRLWFLNDIIILNPYELTLPAAGGADTDGDKFAVVEEESIVDAIVGCDYIPFDDGIKATPVKYESEEDVKEYLRNYFRATSKSSQIGLITNYATNYRDLELHDNSDYNNIILGLRFLQGWEIDRAKTGAIVEIPEVISQNELVPHWKYFLGQFNRKVNNDLTDFLKETESYYNLNEYSVSNYAMELKTEKNIYQSNSPIGKLFDYVCNRGKELFSVDKDKKNGVLNNFSGALATAVNSETVILVEGAVRELEVNYRKELVSILSTITDKDDNDKRMLSMEALSAKYTDLVKSLSDDHLALSVACYRASYSRKNNETSSRSFPWTVMFDELLEVIQSLDNSVKLVRLPKVDNLQSVKVSNANMLFLNGMSFGTVAINPGSYTHTVIAGDNYLLAKRIKPIQTYVYSAPTEKSFQVTLRGFAKLGLTALNIADFLADGNFSIQLINDVPSIIKDGKIISGVASDDSINVAGLYNKALVMKSYVDPKFTPKRITNDIHWFDQANVIAIAKSLTITFKVVSDLDEKDIFVQAPAEESSEYSESITEYNEYQADYSVEYSEVIDTFNGLNPLVVETIQTNFDGVWDLNSIDAPAHASNVTIEQVEFNMNDGVKAIVTLYAGTVGYKYSVVKTGRELSIVTSLPTVKETTKSWLKRYVAYNLISVLIG